MSLAQKVGLTTSVNTVVKPHSLPMHWHPYVTYLKMLMFLIREQLNFMVDQCVRELGERKHSVLLKIF